MNPGRAETTLGPAVGYPRLLQWVQVLRRADTFYGGDLAELVHPAFIFFANTTGPPRRPGSGAGPRHTPVPHPILRR